MCDSLETFHHVVMYPAVAQLDKRKIGVVLYLVACENSEERRAKSEEKLLFS